MQHLWHNYSNLIGSANTVAASMKNSLVISYSFPHEHYSHGPDIVKKIW